MTKSFYEILCRDGQRSAPQKNRGIEEILAKDHLDIQDFQSLLSKEAGAHLEPMARRAQELTLRHFGKTISLYAPLYLSNYCENECVYCGFNRIHNIQRRKLNLEEVAAEADLIARSGLRHILLLTGESRAHAPVSYIKECAQTLRQRFAHISIEIFPLETEEYKDAADAGVDGLTIYQETYDETLYASLHPRGPKADFRFRLDAPQRGCQAHYREVNIGALLGLRDWRQEIYCLGLHAQWLRHHYAEVEIGVSLPRLKKHTGAFAPPEPVSERSLVWALVALRLFLPQAAISISTRESRDLRRNLIGLGITRMSAGSRTEVGGYAQEIKTEGQFEIEDNSSVEDVREMIAAKGYQPVSKNWQAL